MEQHDFLQCSPEWHQHRSSHFNASDAPAMLGISPYKTRSQLLREMATGITADIDASTQRRFDDGHRFEALARPLAEQIIGKKLYPVIGSEGKLSASFDGLTADDSIAFEHKTLNNSLRLALYAGEIPEQYRAQMEQQLMLSGAEKCLFMASSWNEADELIEEMHLWYLPSVDMRYRILQGWEQFEKDLANYQHIEHAEKPKAEAILNLPALSVQATGMVTYSNLPEFKAAAESYIANINTDLQTDQQFADAEDTVKFCKSTEETLEVTKKAILAQTATIDEVIRTVDHIQAQLRDKRLMLDKLVKSEKEARKIALTKAAGDAYAAHVVGLQSEIGGVQFVPLLPRQDFGAVIKGLKSLSSMHDALDTALANAKIEADAVAKDIRAKLAWCKENASGMSFLFPDLQQIISKPMDDFTLTITSRIKEHKEAEERKVAEIRAKAEAYAAAKLEAERAAMQAEEEAKARAKVEVEASKNTPTREASGNASAGAQPAAASQTEPAAPAISVVQLPSRHPRPTDAEIIEALALNFRVHESKVIEWLLDMDLNEACERMAKEFA